jgi:hypothetical protein
MKKLIFFGLIIFMTIGSYAQGKKYPLEGTWKLVAFDKSIDTSLQDMIKNGQIKTFSKKYFTFVGHFEQGTSIYESYGGGTYTLNGDRYEESIIYQNDKSLINKKFKALDEIRNDTLIHRYNTDDSWKLRKGYFTEKYVRLK